jgi:hypothetical protein
MAFKNTSATERHTFTKYIVDIMEIIDDLALGNQIITDIQYKNAMEHLKKLYELKDKLKRDTVFIYLERARRQNRSYTSPPSLLQKMEDKKNYICCNRCDRFVKLEDLDTHQERTVCQQILESKKTTLITKEMETTFHQKTQVLARALRNIDFFDRDINH